MKTKIIHEMKLNIFYFERNVKRKRFYIWVFANNTWYTVNWNDKHYLLFSLSNFLLKSLKLEAVNNRYTVLSELGVNRQYKTRINSFKLTKYVIYSTSTRWMCLKEYLMQDTWSTIRTRLRHIIRTSKLTPTKQSPIKLLTSLNVA